MYINVCIVQSVKYCKDQKVVRHMTAEDKINSEMMRYYQLRNLSEQTTICVCHHAVHENVRFPTIISCFDYI